MVTPGTLHNTFKFPSGARDEEKLRCIDDYFRDSQIYLRLKRIVKEQIIKGEVTIQDLNAEYISDLTRRLRLDSCIRNVAIRLDEQGAKNQPITVPSRPHLPLQEIEPLATVRQARKEWEESVKEDTLAFIHSKGGPIASRDESFLQAKRNPKASNGKADGAWPRAADTPETSTSASYVQAPKKVTKMKNVTKPKLTYPFDSEDLLESIANIKSPNHVSQHRRALKGWGLIQVKLYTPTILHLRAQFSELSPSCRQVGLDNERDAEWAAAHSLRCTQALRSSRSIKDLAHCARRGVPASLRRDLWSKLLGCTLSPTGIGARPGKAARAPAVLAVDEHARAYFALLQAQAREWYLVLDDLYKEDIAITSNSEMYFVFADKMTDVLMAFSRDSMVSDLCEVPVHGKIHVGDDSGARVGLIPPCGVVPFSGLASYSAPLCFFSNDLAIIYFLFRAMFTRYWCRLNTVCSRPGMLLPLCRLFEQLLVRRRPDVYCHLFALGVHPLQLAFPWIRFAFVQYLNTHQVLHLWDRIIGYDSLSLLPVLAAAIFVYRAPQLLVCKSVRQVQDVFADPSQLKVVTLLQLFLFV